jgi:hypothetical protein
VTLAPAGWRQGTAIQKPTHKAPPLGGEWGFSIRRGCPCYVCDRPLRAGESAVKYEDPFWGQVVIYHAACWAELDHGPDANGQDRGQAGRVLEVAGVACSGCGRVIDELDLIHCLPGNGPRQALVLHARCSEALTQD